MRGDDAPLRGSARTQPPALRVPGIPLHDFGAPRLRVRPGGGLPLSAQADPAYPATADGAIRRKKYLTETFNCRTSGNSG